MITNSQIQTQQQKLVQQQRLTAQQILQVRLVEMPLAELEQHVQAEVDDNPALEELGVKNEELGVGSEEFLTEPTGEAEQGGGSEDTYEMEERREALSNALERMGVDDDIPVARSYYTDEAERETMAYGEQTSFYDSLKEQMGEVSLTPQQHDVMEYVIGSLDSDGLLRKDSSSICDELALYHNIYTSEEEVEQIIGILQTFDPAGIGARSLQECLLIQLRHARDEMQSKDAESNPSSLTAHPSPSITDLCEQVIAHHYDDFTHNNWQAIAESMGMKEETAREVRREILRLNPKPGSAMGETEGRSIQQITPDFIVETADDGSVSFYLNRGRVPELCVSPMFNDIVNNYQQRLNDPSGAGKRTLNRQEKDAYVYAKDKIERAQAYINALQQRRRTLYTTMHAIIDMQHPFFAEGDENLLKPMVLKDVAQRTGLDISTISRVCNSKYCQTRWGIFRLRYFFSEGVKTADGGQFSVHQVKNAMQEIVNTEDRLHPLSDDQLAAMMKERGFPIARRTVAKYRELLGIPIARMRRGK